MSKASLEIGTESVGGRVKITVSGELELASAPVLAAELRRHTRSGQPVELDLRSVSFMDSSGIQLLIDAHRGAEDTPGSLRIAQASAAVRRLLGLVGMERFLPS
ncbi:MAG: STAS domain-containing protein [Actinomycetota bacterium]|nr:STAS domain-containing protein [Actinomycetota bacterium]